MRNILVAVMFALAIPSLVVNAQTDPAKPKPSPAAAAAAQMGSAEQELTKLDRDLMDAAVRKDHSLMERIAVARHVFINPAGAVQELGDTAGPMIESIQPENVQVRLHGDTAILLGQANVKGRFPDGPDISGSYRYMRVFVKQQGQWRLVATQITRIEPAMPAATPKP